ncbi:MAG: AbrB/MazE/SpoVT family DNA-binding domain-containing protein [Opitutaceae bacterium]|nr:AbrB/MazE/SpoVT family DNA-binding domain-containing protein [Opitutaceae bacterium]
MTSKLSSKGQIVLPKKVRSRLHLRPGATLLCTVKGGSIVLTPESAALERPKFVTEPKTGLRITKSPEQIRVSSEDVRAAMLDFP